MFKFTTKNGEVLQGKLVHQYGAYEGGMRYIFSANGKEYRCVKLITGEFVEYIGG